MIRIEMLKTEDRLCGFRCSGHAGYAEEGEDIVCAAVSALTISCVNSLEKLSKDDADVKERDGFVSCRLKQPASPGGELLLRSLQLGVENIAEEYPQYVKVTVKSL